jgi:hypothetical protein
VTERLLCYGKRHRIDAVVAVDALRPGQHGAGRA